MTAKKPAAKKRATKKTAAKQPPEPEIQVNRMTETKTDDAQTEEQRLAEQDQANDQAESEQSEQGLTPGRHGKEEVPEYEPTRIELEHAGFDHHSAEEKRQAELAEEREAHNRRTGDASR
jgi:hypothetical protein